MKKSKKYRQAQESFKRVEKYSLKEGLAILSKFPKTKFDETVELAIKLAINPTKSDQQMRGAIDLPHGTGQSKRVAVFTETKTAEAKKSKADIVGGEDLIEKVMGGKIDFDVAIATPEIMPKLAKVAKILGPRGLMPNPKSKTVGLAVENMINSMKQGRSEFKTDKGGNIHQIIGKRSFKEKDLEENATTFLDYLRKNKPATVKGKLIKHITLSATMTPSIQIKL